MKLLLINPNISVEVSALIEAEARRTAASTTSLHVATAPLGFAYIETRFEALVGAYAAAQVAAEQYQGYDAVIIAAFGDPGVAGIRELLPVPVVGLTECALASACLLGHRFSIITISQRIQSWYREVVASYGMTDRLASMRGLDEPLAGIGAVQKDHATRLVQLCGEAVARDGADVIILAGAPLAGLARSLAGQLPVPVVDGVSSAVQHAQSLVSLSPGTHQAGSFRPPPVKPHKGLPEAIASILNRSVETPLSPPHPPKDQP